MTIHPFSADCHKNIARFHFAGIDYDSCRFFAGIAADYSHSRRRTGSGMLSRRHSQMPLTGSCNIPYRHVFHITFGLHFAVEKLHPF